MTDKLVLLTHLLFDVLHAAFKVEVHVDILSEVSVKGAIFTSSSEVGHKQQFVKGKLLDQFPFQIASEYDVLDRTQFWNLSCPEEEFQSQESPGLF